MYFFIDESGQTGSNLFDKDQPLFYYGVINSKLNLDVLALPDLIKMRKKLGVERLHAKKLGNDKIELIAHDILKLKRKFNFMLDIYVVNKYDYAIITFFDQIFDQGMNDAVPWTSYWTPLRYILLIKLAYLFSEELAIKAWQARTMENDESANKLLAEICQAIIDNVDTIPDERSREIIVDVLLWAKKHPEKIKYNSGNKTDNLQISPNLIGFQSVLHGIARRLKTIGKTSSTIIVDRQLQFNPAQEWLASAFNNLREIPFVLGPGMPLMDLRTMPSDPIRCTPGTDSVGLELVDIYLWIFKRITENKYVPDSLKLLIQDQSYHGLYDEISLQAISARWSPFFDSLPNPEGEQLERLKEQLEAMELERKQRQSI